MPGTVKTVSFFLSINILKKLSITSDTRKSGNISLWERKCFKARPACILLALWATIPAGQMTDFQSLTVCLFFSGGQLVAEDFSSFDNIDFKDIYRFKFQIKMNHETS
jgi:hypothetical protein